MLDLIFYRNDNNIWEESKTGVITWHKKKTHLNLTRNSKFFLLMYALLKPISINGGDEVANKIQKLNLKGT